MPIRLRLTLWFGGLSLAVIAALTFVSLAVHVRSQYEELDRLLVSEVDDYRQALRLHGAAEPLPAFHGRVQVRLYGAQMEVLPASPLSSAAAPLPLDEVLRDDDGPAYGPPLSWLPAEPPGEGSFSVASEPESGERLRVYATRLQPPESGVAYVQAWTSLAAVDDSIDAFRLLVGAVAAGGLLAILLGAVAVAGNAIAPIRGVTRAARAIAASRDFDQRIPELARDDELGELTRTFNGMLASLEEAYLAQQRFVADAAHELRAPLAAARSSLDMLERVEDLDPAERREAVQLVRDEMTRLTRLVNDLLTLARADANQALQSAPVELDEVLLRTLSEMRGAAEQHRVVIGTLEPLVVTGDAFRLQDLLVVLLENAIQYTPAGGEVNVSLRREADEAVLSVSDTGVGISPSDLPHVFERFYRADRARQRSHGGTGLGLSIARWIVDRHGGQISLTSEPGRGTRVEVRLPLGEPADGV